MNDYEYRVIKSSPTGNTGSSGVTSDSKEAGAIFRSIKKNMNDGESSKLQRRQVGPWETVESTPLHQSTSPLRQPGD